MAVNAQLLGVFAHVDTALKAIEGLKAKGLSDITVYTPVPVDEIQDAMERDKPVSRVRLFTLIGGLTGTITGFALTIWTALKWNLVTGGKPIVSIPPFVIIAFEMTILLGGLSTLLGLLVLGKLPRLSQSVAYDPRFSVDRFGVAVRCPADRIAETLKCLGDAGAEEIRR